MRSSNNRLNLLVTSLICFLLITCSVDTDSQKENTDLVEAIEDPNTGQLILREAGQPILQYNYWTIEPGAVLEQVSENNVKYTRPRSNYIHPLYGLDGEELTLDWPIDHPHHRGIYWAWPEVKLGETLADLHALQIIFARPTGKFKLNSGPEYGEIEAENRWLWEDQEPVVHELAILRAYKREQDERIVDLEFHFTALKENISLARRRTNLYGGLNVRLSSVDNQEIQFFTDPEGSDPRMAWAQLSGTFSRGGKVETGVSILQNRTNPDYPGDWVEYPELNWFQPTFPAAESRYVLKQEEPLVLRYRIWIHRGKAGPDLHASRWQEYDTEPFMRSRE